MGRNFGVVGPAYNIHHEMNIHTYMIKGNIPRRAGTHEEKKTVYIGLTRVSKHSLNILI
jgi:hypothetical protein